MSAMCGTTIYMRLIRWDPALDTLANLDIPSNVIESGISIPAAMMPSIPQIGARFSYSSDGKVNRVRTPVSGFVRMVTQSYEQRVAPDQTPFTNLYLTIYLELDNG